jgi:1-acyl-sn-glycerol-3-phosphate acyltransferase
MSEKKSNQGKAIESGFIKSLLYFIIGLFSYPGINIISRLNIKGMDKLKHLPRENVMFVSNHQTYFADVITMIHIFCASSWGKKKKLGIPFYLLKPFTKIKYVAAAATMNSTFISRFFTLAGAITVKRAWNTSAGEVRKGLELGDTREIARALESNWVINFPQGTTTPFAPGRKGTAFIIKNFKPIVVPVVINGFSETFDKTGMKIKKWNSKLEVSFKDPLIINYEASNEDILKQVMEAIEQIAPEENQVKS